VDDADNDLEQLKEELKERCKNCEWNGIKVSSPPYWIPCKLKETCVEKCIIHANYVRWFNVKKYNKRKKKD